MRKIGTNLKKINFRKNKNQPKNNNQTNAYSSNLPLQYNNNQLFKN